jgi:AraC family transcriptional regulator
MINFSGVSLAQKNGDLPATLAVGSAPGESGITVLRLRFQDGAHLSATKQPHLICFQMSQQARFECRMAGRALLHEVAAGGLAICPAGIDSTAETAASVDLLLIAVQPCRFALAAAEESALDARLNERLSGSDPVLFDFARALASESADRYPNGPLFWNGIADAFVRRLVVGHASKTESRARGVLSKDVLQRVRDYVVAHLAEPIDVTRLAEIAGRSSFHFSRVFARSVGATPHRYVVHLRLQRAIELVREGQAGLAEIAAATGFADQSHLSRWVRRVHGVSLTQLTN